MEYLENKAPGTNVFK